MCLCQPLEDSLQRKEDFIKVLNGPILLTINKKINNNQADLHLWLIQFSFIYTALNHKYFIALLKHNISTVSIYM